MTLQKKAFKPLQKWSKADLQERVPKKVLYEMMFESFFDKAQPNAIPLEEAVLGACMIDQDAFPIVMGILKIESFYDYRHRHIYEAMLALYDKSLPIDLLTITDQLKKLGPFKTDKDKENEFGPFYLVELTNRVASAANIEYHARIIQQKYIKRSLGNMAIATLQGVKDDTKDVFELLDETENAIIDIGVGQQNKIQDITDAGDELLRQQEAVMQQEEKFLGVSTGLVNLDNHFLGWKPELIIMAARPGMGKTAVAHQICKNSATLGHPVALFSLEMAKVEVASRFHSSEAEIEGKKFRGKLEPEEFERLAKSVAKFEGLPYYIDDQTNINIHVLCSRIKQLVTQKGVRMVVIDYLQLISTEGMKGKDPNTNVSVITRRLKNLSQELGVPIIALSQLNRAVETRGSTKRPQLSDLRDSGSIEQDANIVTFIYRPEYYGILEDEEGKSTKGKMIIIVAKFRGGDLCDLEFKWVEQYVQVKDIDDPNFLDMNNQNISVANNPFDKNNAISKEIRGTDKDDIPF